MTRAKIHIPTKKAVRKNRKPKTRDWREQGLRPPLLATDLEHVDDLLDEALQATFPASDPVAIGSARVAGRGK